MYDQTRYWLTPNGEVIPVLDTHDRTVQEIAGLNRDEALQHGWIRAIQVDQFGDFWWFETANAFDGRTFELIEAFVVSPDNPHRGDEVAASISTNEPTNVSFPVRWLDLEDWPFEEAAARSFQRERRRKGGRRWYELRGAPRRRGRSRG